MGSLASSLQHTCPTCQTDWPAGRCQTVTHPCESLAGRTPAAEAAARVAHGTEATWAPAAQTTRLASSGADVTEIDAYGVSVSLLLRRSFGCRAT